MKVSNDLLLTADSGTVLILLDLSSALNMVDHNIFRNCLEGCAGSQDTALAWFRFYHPGRPFSSCPAPLSCGVPQGSLPSPKLFSTDIRPLGQIICRYNINFHCYMANTQLVLLSGSNRNNFLMLRLVDIKCWMSQNFLESKPEVL